MRYQNDAANVTTFPYLIDNVPTIKDSFTVTKVYDNIKRGFRSANDSKVEDLDIKVAFPFSIREVVHNAALNSDFVSALRKNDQKEMLYALLTDYELNYRQLVIYLIDCVELEC